MERPFPAYKGDEPYIFVSYAHADDEIVYPEIRWLHDQGFNVWYDEGISPGREWTEELGNAIADCAQLLYYISPASAASQNCRDELQFALKRAKPIVTIHIEPTELPVGLELSIGSKQALLKHEIPEADYWRKLLAALDGDGAAAKPSTGLSDTKVEREAIRSPMRGYRAVAAVVVVAVLGLLGWVGSSFLGTSTSAPIRSIAVLPLDNLSRDPNQEYFTDGMTEALTAELGRIKALRVISRTSAMHYKATDKLLPEIARELKVDALLEGSVLRAGDEVRITLQLVHGPTDRHLWSKTYQRDLQDVLALQGEVARAIAEEMQITLTPQAETQLARARTVDPKAYQLWLKGNFHLGKLNEESFTNALRLFQEAIDQDPSYAAAYAGLAMAYMGLGSWHSSKSPHEVVPLAKAAAERALALDSTVAEAHLVLARIRQLFEWDWAGAELFFKQGIALNPRTTSGRLDYANFLTAMGRFQESIEFGRKTLELDPLSPEAYNELGWAVMSVGRYDEALELFREGLEIDPEFQQSHALIAGIYMKRGESQKGLALRLRGGQAQSPASMGYLGNAYARAGRQAEARAFLTQLMERRAQAYVPASALAVIHIGLGEHEKALRWLEVAYEERDISLVWLNELFYYDSLRPDPRFQAILERMNFPRTDGN